jgi:uncharacterized protein
MLNKPLFKLAGFLLINTICQATYAQTDNIDIAIFNAKNNNQTSHQYGLVKANNNENHSKGILFGLLGFYKRNISQQISAECLYEISCSSFSQMALKEFGILKGIALTADRLARCNRISGTTINEYRINENGKVNDVPSMYKLNND